jgi:hypothetical protein
LIGSRWADINVEDAISGGAKAYGVMCLSRNCNDPLLWAHYADKHRGICLGIDILDHMAQSAIYIDQRESTDPQILWKALNEGSAEEPAEDTVNAIMRKYLVKYEGWRYEDEVRMFSRAREEKGLAYLKFNDEDFILREVILGLRSTITKKTIVNRLRGYGHEVEILKATVSPDEFRIIPRPIDECASSLAAHS